MSLWKLEIGFAIMQPFDKFLSVDEHIFDFA